MMYGYARSSLVDKDVNEQIEQLKKAGCENIYVEEIISNERPKFQELLSTLKKDDTLVVTKLDHFARSAIQSSQLIQKLLSQCITVHIINIGKLDNTPTTETTRNIIFSFADFEKNMMIERAQESKLHAKKNNPNFKEGRPRTPKEQLDKAMKMLTEGLSYKEVALQTGISKATVYREARDRGLTKKQQEIAITANN